MDQSLAGIIASGIAMITAVVTLLKQQKEKVHNETVVEEARQHVEQKAEEARLTIEQTFRMYESTVAELRIEVTALEKKEKEHKADLLAHMDQVKKLRDEIVMSETTNTDLKKQVQKYQVENAELSARTTRLISELEKLNEALKDQTMKLRREPEIL